MKSRKYILIAILSVFSLCGTISGCSPSNVDSSSAGTAIIGGAGTPAKISVAFTGGLTPTSIVNGASVNVNATVLDSANNVVSGATVTFAFATPGAGTFTPGATAVTNASGVATVQFNDITNDITLRFTASVTTATGAIISNTASLTIGSPPPPVPASMTLTINPASIDILGQTTVTVTVLDSTGNPAFGASVTLDIPVGAGLGSFSATSSVTTLPLVTNASGQATATFYAGGSSGIVTIRATIAVPSIVQSSSLSINSVPNSVNVTASPLSVTVGGTSNITANVLNILNNPVPDGTVVTFSCFAGNCAAGTFPTTATTVGGAATITFTASATQTGSIIVQASAGTSPVVTGTVTITVNAAATSSIQFTSASPNIIGIVGSGVGSTSIVIFTVKDSNGNPQPGILVDFLLFGPTGSSIGPVLLSTTDSGSTGSTGQVSTILHAGTVAGPARITATVNGTAISISTSSGNISIGGGLPSATHFGVAVSKFNLEGLAFDNITSTLTAFLADRFGNYNVLQGTSVSFATDSGAIGPNALTDANGIASVTYRTQNPRPTDVPPIPGEPFYTVAGHTYNPRDGWITVVAMTTGEESFVDENADGLFTRSYSASACPSPPAVPAGFICECDTGPTFFVGAGAICPAGLRSEAFQDLGEPFIDSDDSGTQTLGELFFDWPSYVPGGTIGTYQTGNNVWDAKIPIWTTVNLVYTGPPSFGANTSKIRTDIGGAGAVTLGAGASQNFTITVCDVNLNTLIGGTTISVTATAGQLTGSTSVTLADGLSFGPTVLSVTLTNTTSTPLTPVFLSATVTWKSIISSVSYPGTITMTNP